MKDIVHDPQLQTVIDQVLSNKHCKGADCSVKLTKDNAVFMLNAASNKHPLGIQKLCRACNGRKLTEYRRAFAVKVSEWGRVNQQKRPDDYPSVEEATMAFVTTIAQGFCVGLPEYDARLFLELRDKAAEAPSACFYCGVKTCVDVNADGHVRCSIDRTQFRNGKALDYSDADQI